MAKSGLESASAMLAIPDPTRPDPTIQRKIHGKACQVSPHYRAALRSFMINLQLTPCHALTVTGHSPRAPDMFTVCRGLTLTIPPQGISFITKEHDDIYARHRIKMRRERSMRRIGPRLTT